MTSVRHQLHHAHANQITSSSHRVSDRSLLRMTFQAALEMTSYAVALLLHKPDQFGMLVGASLCATAASALFYTRHTMRAHTPQQIAVPTAVSICSGVALLPFPSRDVCAYSKLAVSAPMLITDSSAAAAAAGITPLTPTRKAQGCFESKSPLKRLFMSPRKGEESAELLMIGSDIAIGLASPVKHRYDM